MIRIEIDTGNDAFQPAHPDGWRQETAWLLHDLADRILTGQSLPVVLCDYNGDRVGQAIPIPSKPSPPRPAVETT